MAKTDDSRRFPKRKVVFTVAVTVPAGMSDTRAAQLLGKILDVGHYDAVLASEDDNLEAGDAALAAALKLGTPKIQH